MIVQEYTLHIDVPFTLAEVKVVFRIASLSFEGDLPASLFSPSPHHGPVSNRMTAGRKLGVIGGTQSANLDSWFPI